MGGVCRNSGGTRLWRIPGLARGDLAELFLMRADSNDGSGQLTPAARVALEELVAYLSDQIPPLFFAESVQDLFGVPPQVVAAQIVAWSSSMP